MNFPNESTAVLNAKKRKWLIPVLTVVVTVAVLIALVALISSGLYGNDKLAYELIIEVAAQFKDPSSVRLVSGSFDDGDLRCVLSAKNGYGSRVSSNWKIYKIGNSVFSYETDYPTSGYKDTKSFDIAKSFFLCPPYIGTRSL